MASSAADGTAPRVRVAWVVAALAALAVPAVITGYHLHLLVMAAIFAILATSLGLVVGYAGLLSLGHTAFFGIGAYTSALLYLKLGLPMWWGMAAAAGLSA